jgi:hypothetical protein
MFWYQYAMLQKAIEDFVIDAQVFSVAIINNEGRARARCICEVN